MQGGKQYARSLRYAGVLERNQYGDTYAARVQATMLETWACIVAQGTERKEIMNIDKALEVLEERKNFFEKQSKSYRGMAGYCAEVESNTNHARFYEAVAEVLKAGIYDRHTRDYLVNHYDFEDLVRAVEGLE